MGRSSFSRASSQRSRALAWHFGQCRFLQELYETASCPHFEHASACPPSAAVRQRRIALNTFRCSQVNHFWLHSKKLSPAVRITSATSTGGPGIYFVPPPVSRLLARGRESSGLAVAFRCCCERWR